jgi:hypothetical protein
MNVKWILAEDPYVTQKLWRVELLLRNGLSWVEAGEIWAVSRTRPYTAVV